jgi:hypothetical protein
MADRTKPNVAWWAWTSGAVDFVFLVQQLEQYRFKMTGISFERQDGCPGESGPNMDQPSMFPVDIKH